MYKKRILLSVINIKKVKVWYLNPLFEMRFIVLNITPNAITDRVIDTIYQLLYRFFMPKKASFQADVLSMRVHFVFRMLLSS